MPRKLRPLLEPKRYKGAYGGRGGAKSHFFAEQTLIKALQGKRIVCIREVQNSIKDSVKQLLSDKIVKLGLADVFTELDQEIRCSSGGLIVFKGMQSYNAQNIKSLEAYDIAWVEEAQTLSDNSLSLLRPTIRNPGSELWFSWNPRYKTDPVDQFFRKSPPPEAISVMVNWEDNPWFPEVLRVDMIRDFEKDPDLAEHIWHGAYGIMQGSILGRWVAKARKEGRINGAEYDPNGAPLEISSDIGFRDTASWWFWQPKVGGFALPDYDQDSGLDADDWIIRLRGKLDGRKLGKIWLPHDARAKTFASKRSVLEAFLAAFGGDKVGIVPQTRKQDQINAARAIISRCEFNEAACEDGINGLEAWEYEYNPDTLVFSKEPKHNWASHPSDAFAYGAQIMQERKPADVKKPAPKFWHQQTAEEIFWGEDKPREQPRV